MKTNLVLIGMPGSGKTTIGRAFAKTKEMNFLDFDDDVLENISLETAQKILPNNTLLDAQFLVKQKVSVMLDTLGEEGFMKMEENITLGIDVSHTVISTSGSVPLYPRAMHHLKKSSFCIYIDVPNETIVSRRENMLTNRIIGVAQRISEGLSEEDAILQVLQYRKNIYHSFCDAKFSISAGESKEQVFEKFCRFYENEIGKKIGKTLVPQYNVTKAL